VRHVIAFPVLAGVGLVLVAAAVGAADQQWHGNVPLTPVSLVGADSYDLYCSSCHGLDARGHGPVAPALTTAPADLAVIACRNGGAFPFEMVRDYINGQRRVIAHGTPDMPVWGATLRGLDPSEGRVRVRIDNLAAYIGTLQIKGTADAPCPPGQVTPAP
jgi:hypothetical protein